MQQLSKYPHLAAYVANLRKIPGGTMQMGYCAANVKERNKMPRITISPFRLGATPVTIAMWVEYCRAAKIDLLKSLYLPEQRMYDYRYLSINQPVSNVAWFAIMGMDGNGGYCAWASKITGIKLILPTEAQYEYACRGGKDGLEYPWGNTFDDRLLWCSELTDRIRSAPVDRTEHIYRNAYGLTDMVGNVQQWCLDFLGEANPITDYVFTSANLPRKDPRRPWSNIWRQRCIRGSSWGSGRVYARCADREGITFEYGGKDQTGFRLAAPT